MFRFSSRMPLRGLSISTDWFRGPDCAAPAANCGESGVPKECDILKFDGPGPTVIAVDGLASGEGERESVKSMTAR